MNIVAHRAVSIRFKKSETGNIDILAELGDLRLYKFANRGVLVSCELLLVERFVRVEARTLPQCHVCAARSRLPQDRRSFPGALSCTPSCPRLCARVAV